MGYMPDIPTKQIRADLKELMAKIIEWDLDDEGYGTTALCLRASLEKGSGKLKWAFSPFLIDKLIADGYTPLKLSIVLDLVGKYALALYENLQMRKSFNKCSFNLKKSLGL